MKDEEYEKLVQAQVEANKRIKAEEDRTKAITSLISLVISVILMTLIMNWLNEVNPSFTMDELLDFFGFSYT